MTDPMEADRASAEEISLAYLAFRECDGNARESVMAALDAVLSRRASLPKPSAPDDTALVAQMAATICGDANTCADAVSGAIAILDETRRQLAEGGR